MVIKAIVIDHDKDLQKTFVELLRANDIEVMETGSNGKVAYELYKKFHPDIVFMDARMPKYDGFYGLEKIREYDPKSVIVLVNGSINVDRELSTCNATAILSKPISMYRIMDVVNKFCPQ